MKTLSILAIVFAFSFTLWFFMFVSSNGRISIDEFAPVGTIFGLWSIAFAIVALVGAFRKKHV